MTTGRILYDNAYRDDDAVGFAYSGAEVVGFEKENARDWKSFSLFRIEAGLTELDITTGGARDVDSFAWFIKKPTNPFKMRLFYESAPAVFTLLASFDSALDPVLGLKTFNKVTVEAARIVRIEFDDGITEEDIRQLVVGERLDFPIGQHEGIRPPNLRGQFKTSNVVGVNGEFIGRDKVRADIQGDISLEFLDPTGFVRDKWLPVMEHAERYAFFYAWDFDTYPNEIVFAWSRENPRPLNSGPHGKMSVSLPFSASAS